MKFCTPQELKKHQDMPSSILILDVRTSEEYNGGHIPHAVNCALDHLTIEKVYEIFQKKGLEMDDLVVITCKAGPRAIKAYELMKDHFENLQVLQGCTDGWIGCNFPIEQS